MSKDEETLKQRASSLKREATEQQSVLYFSLETKANLSLQLEDSAKRMHASNQLGLQLHSHRHPSICLDSDKGAETFQAGNPSVEQTNSTANLTLD